MKINVQGLYRDSESYIYESLKRFESLLDMPYDFEFFFYENDSKDHTYEILEEWSRDFPANIISENIGTKKYTSNRDIERCVNMAYYRNKLNEKAKNTYSDLTLLVDTDIDWNVESINKMISFVRFEDIAISANCRQEYPDLMTGRYANSYYDTYAFRDKYGNEGLLYSDCPSMSKVDEELWETNIPIVVDSAFGGLFMLSSDKLNYANWLAYGSVEHIYFCKTLRSLGVNIYIDPKIKCWADISEVKVDPLWANNIVKMQKDKKNKIQEWISESITR